MDSPIFISLIMININNVTIVGRVGQDPEFKTFDNGGSIARISVATSERGYTLQNGTQVPEKTDWHSVIIRNKSAEFVNNYIRKGDIVGITGSIHYRKYTDKNGAERMATDIYASSIQAISKDGGQPQQTQTYSAPTTGQITAAAVQNDLPF